MTNNTPNISDILGFLTDILSRGWLALQTCKHLDIAYKNKEINCARYFFSATYQSCMESAVLTLSKIIIRNNDSITIYYLLNMVQNNTRQFSKESKTDILKKVNKHKGELEQLKSFVENLTIHRDKNLAHFDKKHVTNPEEVFSQPEIDLYEVESVYNSLFQILKIYTLFLHNSESIVQQQLERGVQEDIDYIVKLIRQANER